MTTTMRPNTNVTSPHYSGWLTFGGLMLIMVGAFNFINGLVALFEDNYYVVGDDGILFFSYTTWGWFWVVIGAIALAAGFGAMSGRMWARVIGVILAIFSALAHLAFLAAYPVWSVVTIALCVAVIYGLTVPPSSARAD
ncbi:MAG: hypothetical protein HOQ05_06940 [Corynebacteriales bacterium]|nr:hypothetical protein [Mycobacteriales bacterium]